MRPACVRYCDRARTVEDPKWPAPGSFWTATIEAIAHLCEAYCHADTGNMDRIVAALAALLDTGRPHARIEQYALAFIVMNLGDRADGGRGSELVKALTAHQKAA